MKGKLAHGAGALAARVALAATVASTVAAGCADGPAVLGRDTSLLVIVIDTLRADHLGAWGYASPTSPRLDRLAEGGVRVASCFANASWTRPSMATLTTGLYGRTTGIYEEMYDLLPADLTTLAERLAARGYLTLGVNSNPNVHAWFGFDQGFASYDDSEGQWQWMAEKTGGPLASEVGIDNAAEVTDRALALVDRHREALAERPFYLQVLYMDPHWPWHAPNDVAALLPPGPLRGYDAEIRFTDRHLERLLSALDERGLLRNTLVVVTADHGEGLRDHPTVPFSRAHGDTLYESVLHVPLIFSHPALAPRVLDGLTSLIDLLPTVMTLLGAPLAAGETPGRSLAAAITGEAGGNTAGANLLFAETDWQEANKVAVRSATHRFVRNDDCRAFQERGEHEGRGLEPQRRRFLSLPIEELHRVDAGVPEDPVSHNRVTAEPAVADELRRALAAWERDTPARPPLRRSQQDVVTLGDGRVAPAVGAVPVPVPDLDPVLRAQLEALGYVPRTP